MSVPSLDELSRAGQRLAAEEDPSQRLQEQRHQAYEQYQSAKSHAQEALQEQLLRAQDSLKEALRETATQAAKGLSSARDELRQHAAQAGDALSASYERSANKTEQFAEWFASFRSPSDIWDKEPTLLTTECIVYLLVYLNFLHARRSGGRYLQFWWATVILSVSAEAICYYVPDLNDLYHSQSSVMLLGRRLPLYVIFVYNLLYYPAFVAVARARLSWWAEPFAVALCSVLMDIPFDIMGVKMLYWMRPQTEGGIAGRLYWTPLSSYCCHAAFSFALYVTFFMLRKATTKSIEKYESGSLATEYAYTLLSAGIAAVPAGVAILFVIYRTLCSVLGVTSEAAILVMLVSCAVVVWIADRRPMPGSRLHAELEGFGDRGLTCYPMLTVTLYYAYFAVLVLLAHPENVVRTGFGQPIGVQNATRGIFTLMGKILPTSRKTVDPAASPDGYYDWHCTESGKPPSQVDLDWYTSCGTRFPSHVEYVIVVWFFCLLGWVVHYQFLCASGKQPLSLSRKPIGTAEKSKSKKDH